MNVLEGVWGKVILEPLQQIMRKIHSSFMVKSTPGKGVHLRSHEIKLSPTFLCLLASILDFQSRHEEIETIVKPEMLLEELPIQPDS